MRSKNGGKLRIEKEAGSSTSEIVEITESLLSRVMLEACSGKFVIIQADSALELFLDLLLTIPHLSPFLILRNTEDNRRFLCARIMLFIFNRREYNYRRNESH